jgi:hypothetical protein
MLTLTAHKPFVAQQLSPPNGELHQSAQIWGADETAILEQVCAFMATKAAPRDLSRSCPWTTPTLGEISIGLEINGYLPAEI